MGFAGRYVHLHLVSAEPEKILTQLMNLNVELRNVSYIDALTIALTTKWQYLSSVIKTAEKHGATCRITGHAGILWMIQSLWKRPTLVTGILVFAIVCSSLNGRVFFVKIQGNEKIPDKLILSEAEDCGIVFGAKTAAVRSEDVKNELMKQLPYLQWVGVTTSGSVATIQVKERSEQKEVIPRSSAVSSIIASRDGIISEMTVYKGNPLFRIGQSVQEGDVLVSGYSDCGIVQVGEQADAEVFAHTLRTVKVCAPTPRAVRGAFVDEHTCYMMRVGKKVINFCNHSGISDATCVKMYEEEYWTLPGGFQLPVSVIKVRTKNFSLTESVTDSDKNQVRMQQFARSYVNEQMIAGKILSEQWIWEANDRFCVLEGNFACHEMIGQIKDEEIIEQNAEDN